jgi:hypothetical protein
LLAGSSTSFKSITPSRFSSEEALCEVWPLFFVGATTSFLPVSRLACSHSSSIASQSTSEGSSSTGNGCASWARGTTSGHSTPRGQETNACALSCTLNWATDSNTNIRMVAHQKSGYYAMFQSPG